MLADEVAHELRGRLYSEPFEHPDPVHLAPSADELATLQLWERMDKTQRQLLARHVGPLSTDQSRFLGRVLFHRP